MGNCVSASTGIAPKIRVVQVSEGRVVDVDLPTLQSSMKVGELMLDFPPGHFLAQLNKADLLASTGKRATPLVADADAKPGAVYMLFPMPRLHTRITPQELLCFAKLLHLHDQQPTKAACKPSEIHVHGCFTSSARVTPVVEDECKDVADTSNEQACPLQREQDQLMLSSCHGLFEVTNRRPWAPTLQTIMESS